MTAETAMGLQGLSVGQYEFFVWRARLRC